jgi:hypothetical protein
MSHSIKEAMERGELDEEEAFFVLRFAGHHGYREAMRRLNPDPWWTRLRQWFVKFGYETPHLCRWDLGWPAWKRLSGLTPLYLFGKAFTFQWFGCVVEIAGKRLCVYWRDRRQGPISMRVFLSPDCTEGSATRWFVGKPRGVFA